MKAFKFIIIISSILLFIGCGASELVDTIDNVTNFETFKSCYLLSCQTKMIVYTKDKIYTYPDVIDYQIISTGPIYVYKNFRGYSLKSEKIKYEMI